jgi:hypothetical protein
MDRIRWGSQWSPASRLKLVIPHNALFVIIENKRQKDHHHQQQQHSSSNPAEAESSNDPVLNM